MGCADRVGKGGISPAAWICCGGSRRILGVASTHDGSLLIMLARLCYWRSVDDKDQEPPATLPFEIDPKRIEESLQKLKAQVLTFAKKGRYTKVRFKFRGKQLLPDLPLAAVVAFEGATFYWTGLLRVLVFNLAGKTVFDVELVNDSEKKIQEAKEAILSGDLFKAEACIREAHQMDPENPVVHLNRGVILKLQGDFAMARDALSRACELDVDGPIGKEAERLLKALRETVALAQTNPRNAR